jgi:hypothetical protein
MDDRLEEYEHIRPLELHAYIKGLQHYLRTFVSWKYRLRYTEQIQCLPPWHIVQILFHENCSIYTVS